MVLVLSYRPDLFAKNGYISIRPFSSSMVLSLSIFKMSKKGGGGAALIGERHLIKSGCF